MICSAREQVSFRLMDVTTISYNFVLQSMGCTHDVALAQPRLILATLHTREKASFSRCKHAGGAGSRES